MTDATSSLRSTLWPVHAHEPDATPTTVGETFACFWVAKVKKYVSPPRGGESEYKLKDT